MGILEWFKPSVKQDEDFAFETVPQVARKDPWTLFAVWCGWVLVTSTLWAGGELGIGLGFRRMVPVTIIGCLVLGVVAVFQAMMGQITGKTAALLNRHVFGVRAATVPSLVLGICLFGWFSFNVAMGASLTKAILLPSAPTWVLALVCGILFTSTALWGIRGLSYLSYVAVPFLAVIAIWAVFRAVGGAGGWPTVLSSTAQKPISLPVAFSAVIGTFITGAVVMPDVMRYGRTTKQAAAVGFATMFGAYQLFVWVGALLVLATGQSDLGVVLKSQGLGFVGWLTNFLLLWTSADNTLYSSGLAFSAATGVNKRIMVVVLAVLGMALAMAGIIERYLSFIVLLGVFVPPIAGVVIAHFWLVCRGSYEMAEGGSETPRAAAATALVGWVAGTVVAWITTYTVPWGIPPLQGILASLVVTWLLHGLTRTSGKRTAAAS